MRPCRLSTRRRAAALDQGWYWAVLKVLDRRHQVGGPWGSQPQIADLTTHRRRRRGLFLIAMVATSLVGFAAPFGVTFILDRLNSTPKRAELPPTDLPKRFTSPIPICTGWARALRRVTCLVDGDTGWEDGVKWRLSDVDTPEISKPGCSRELQQGLAARARLQELMGAGYSV